MKIALTGHSGSGKTTLAAFIENQFGIPFIPGSAGLTFTRQQVEDLKLIEPSWKQDGHSEVIKLSNLNPIFGNTFQAMLLEQRAKWQRETQEFITDRSTVDNMVYYLLQCSHNQKDKEVSVHLNNCFANLGNLTHLIYIMHNNPDGIEDNGSRVANRYYQLMTDTIFNMVITKWVMPALKQVNTKLLIINTWDLERRKKLISDFLQDDYEGWKQAKLDKGNEKAKV